MKTRNSSKSIHVVAFDHDGRRVKKFASIHSFRHYAKIHRLESRRLREIQKGNLVMVGKYLLGLSSKFDRKKVTPILCKDLMKRFMVIKRKNIEKLKKFHQTHKMIVMINNNLEILGYHWGSIVNLARKEKVPVGTIKASLHWSPTGYFNDGRPAKYYMWMSDIPEFLSHAKKSPCTR